MPFRVLCFVLPRPPLSSLFPYPTLFRSADVALSSRVERRAPQPTLVLHRSMRERRHHASRGGQRDGFCGGAPGQDRKSTRLNSSHSQISYAVFSLKKKI